MQAIIIQHPKSNWMYPLIPNFSFLFSAHDIGKTKQWGTILDFLIYSPHCHPQRYHSKMPCPQQKKISSTYRLKPRPLRKASRLLFLRLRASFPISFLESYINFWSLARFFYPTQAVSSLPFLDSTMLIHAIIYTSEILWLDYLASPSLAYESFNALTGSLSWQAPSWFNCLLLMCSLEILSGLLVLTVSLLKKLQQEC